MVGRVRRQLQAQQWDEAWARQQAQLAALSDDGWPCCPLCDRPIPPDQRDAHHLIPKSKGGRYTADLHRICHRQLHALFTETELARSYHTVDALLAHPEVAAFVAWVRTKPPGFHERTRKSQRLRRR